MNAKLKPFALVLAAAMALVCSGLCDNAYADEYKALFDGKSLTGWEGNLKFWSVKDGTIQGQTTARESDARQYFLDLARWRTQGL